MKKIMFLERHLPSFQWMNWPATDSTMTKQIFLQSVKARVKSELWWFFDIVTWKTHLKRNVHGWKTIYKNGTLFFCIMHDFFLSMHHVSKSINDVEENKVSFINLLKKKYTFFYNNKLRN